MELDVVAFQVFVYTVSTSFFTILAKLHRLTILDLLVFLSSRQIEILDHVHAGNSCEVVELVLLAELIKLSAQIYFFFNTVSARYFAFYNEWFLSCLLVSGLLLDLLQICY